MLNNNETEILLRAKYKIFNTIIEASAAIYQILAEIDASNSFHHSLLSNRSNKIKAS